MFPIQFGFCVPIFASPGGRLFRTPNYARLDPAKTMDLAVQAEAMGYDSLWVADHLMLGHEEAILEGWTTLSALAGATSRIRLGGIHLAHFFRHPSMTAKAAATLDAISGGRLIHFIDAGSRPAEFEAYGLPWKESPEDRVAHLVEGLRLTLAMWSGRQPVDYEGAHYRVKGAVCRPGPVQTPHPPVWLGETHPGVLDACARYAQGWNTVPADIPKLREKLGLLKGACERAGRPYGEIEKSLEMQVLIAPSTAMVRERLRQMIALSPAAALEPDLAAFLRGGTDEVPPSLARTTWAGTPDEVAAQARACVEEGVTHFLLWFLDVPATDGMRLFADEVAGVVRAAATPRLRSA